MVDLEYTFPDGTGLWPGLTFNIYRGQKIALAGPNGCGKSTLLKVIGGRLEKSGGSVVMGTLVRMGFFSQHQLETLNPSGTVLGEIRRLSDPRTTEEELMSVLGLFLLGQNYFDRVVGELSGGEKSRLILAALFLARCNFLVLDEPTNHLDLESREALVEALQNYEGTILMVAHDRHLLSSVADEIWALSPAGVAVYEGGFEEYDAARRQQGESGSLTPGAGEARRETPSLSRDDMKRIKREQAEQRNALYKELKPRQDAYAKLEKQLETSLAEQAEVEQTLASGNAAGGVDRGRGVAWARARRNRQYPSRTPPRRPHPRSPRPGASPWWRASCGTGGGSWPWSARRASRRPGSGNFPAAR